MGDEYEQGVYIHDDFQIRTDVMHGLMTNHRFPFMTETQINIILDKAFNYVKTGEYRAIEDQA
jgi:hypothetical protein